mmetsp:Transcript_47752/g.159167  ORF Transcript_47752/g.159167 Transcript_47752/m.159167 type:complete len:317 (-) Transcript_47752:137-1087(-)
MYACCAAALQRLTALLGWAALALASLWWGLPAPLVCTAIWLLLRPLASASLAAGASEAIPPWLSDPWGLCAHAFCRVHGIRIYDAADAPPRLLLPGVLHFRGAVLMNHRSWGDFAVDPAQAHAVVIARTAAVAATMLSGLLGVCAGRVLAISRSDTPCWAKTAREDLARRCRSHKRYLLYPEGTRRAFDANADEPVPLRVGGLKNVYESGDAALVVITVGKEKIMDERRGRVSFSSRLYRATSEPLHPSDHSTLDSFLSAVDDAWRDAWRRAYQLRHDHLEHEWSEAPLRREVRTAPSESLTRCHSSEQLRPQPSC